MNATTVFAETPNVAAATNTPLSGCGLKKVKPVTIEFKQQLESSCEEMTALMALVLAGSGNTNDNSMAIDFSVKETEIAGILEGFGLLDYQTDTLPAPIENAPYKQQAVTPLVQTDELPKEQTQIIEAMKQMGVSEQFARMLDQKLESLPQPMQQQIRSEVQKYLGSLESTNNVKTLFTVPESPAGSVSAQDVQDKLSALLIQLKTAPKEAPTLIDTHVDAVIDGEYYVPKEAQTVKAPQAQPGPIPASENKQEAEPAMHMGVQPQAAQVFSTAKINAVDAGTDDIPKADFVKDNVIRIVDKVRTNVSEGRHEFDVDLKPDFLGKVSIRLTMENGSIRMHIRTEDMVVKGLFTDEMSGLQSLLKDKGLPVTSIDVSYQSEMSAGGGYEEYRQNGGHSGGNHSGTRSGACVHDAVSGTDHYDAMAGNAEFYFGGSSVEYLA